MQAKIKYRLFSFLIFFTAMNMAVASPVIAHPEKTSQASISTKLQQSATDMALLAEEQYSLTDAFISTTPVLQIGINLAGKRVQTDKDLLLLHAVEYSQVVKTATGNQVQAADSLTHIFLFLFPHHFFW